MTPQGYRCPNCNAMLPISKTYRGICTCECCGSEYRIKSEYESMEVHTEIDIWTIQKVIQSRVRVAKPTGSTFRDLL